MPANATPSLPHSGIFATRRRWRECFDRSSFSRPHSYADSMVRLRRNFNYFRVNYAMVMLFILFVSIIYHPISMIIFLLVFIAWFFLYFFRSDPVLLFHRPIDDRILLSALSLTTILALVFTNVGVNVLVSLIIGIILVAAHAISRGSDDVFLDEHDAAARGLISTTA